MQSTNARIAVAIGSIALIALLFVLLSGSDGGEEQSAGQTQTTEAAAEGAGNGNAPDSGDGSGKREPAKDGEDSPKSGGSSGGAEQTPLVEIVDGLPKGGPAELEFTKGEEVKFRVVSDAPEEIHVHGYEIFKNIDAGEPGTLRFPAEIDGIYEIEVHDPDAEIARLIIRP